MNRISFELALLRQDERLREAAERRLARGPAATPKSLSRLGLVLRPHQLRLSERARPAVRG